jgi:hypothetical protein
MTIRPSPDPRSMTRSFLVTFAMSSILLTIPGEVGTHTASRPAMPTVGSYGLGGGWATCVETSEKASSSGRAVVAEVMIDINAARPPLRLGVRR